MTKKMLLTMMGIMSASVSISVLAEWTAVEKDNVKVVYIDVTSIRRVGNTVKMWSLSDFKVEQEVAGERFLSEKMQHAADCKEEQMTPLAMVVFRGNMGNGTVVFSDNVPPRWKPVSPESFGEKLLKIACGNIQ